MDEIERLTEWMKDANQTTADLAREMGMSYAGIYQVIYVRRKVSDGFKLRFIARYGVAVADGIFEPLLSPTQPEPTPAPA